MEDVDFLGDVNDLYLYRGVDYPGALLLEFLVPSTYGLCVSPCRC